MSKSDETALDEAQGEQNTGSVYDFLYHDARRIGSFVSQIDPSGHLIGLKQTETAESGSGMRSSASVGGNVVIARGGASLEDQRSDAERESLERTYDPLWANALGLLDLLDERRMIRDGLAGSRIGHFVKVSGSISVSDLTMWRGLWSLPALKQMLAENAKAERQAARAALPNRAAKRAAFAGSKTSSDTLLQNEMASALALIEMLPHTIQARLKTEAGETVWCSLGEDGMVVSASDLTLKHGVAVSGRWTMVGVLDALPDPDTGEALAASGHEAVEHSVDNNASPFGDLTGTLTPIIRGLLGRPNGAYGMTPLVIFRQIFA